MLCSSEFRQVDQGGDVRLIDESLTHGLRSIEVLDRLPPSDSAALAHAYLVEVYLYKGMINEARIHYAIASDVADKLRLHWLRDRLAAEYQSRIGAPAIQS
jgi:hypothetical protein